MPSGEHAMQHPARVPDDGSETVVLLLSVLRKKLEWDRLDSHATAISWLEAIHMRS